MTHQQLQAEATLDHFAELLSLDLSLTQIAERMGVRRARASQLLMKLRQRLGPQAK
jgi:DNA-binding IclR family transcriptional regulator